MQEHIAGAGEQRLFGLRAQAPSDITGLKVDQRQRVVHLSEHVALVGPSGAGKTTLIRTIVGLQKVSSGGVDVLDLPAGHPLLREQIGYMAQDSDVYIDLTVEENINYFGLPHTNTCRLGTSTSQEVL